MTTIAVGLLLGVTAPVVMLAAMDTVLAAPVATNTMTELGVDTARLLVALLWTTIRLLPHGAATKSPTTAITHRPQRPMATVAHTIDPLATSHLANLHTLLERDTRLVNTSAVVATGNSFLMLCFLLLSIPSSVLYLRPQRFLPEFSLTGGIRSLPFTDSTKPIRRCESV